MFAMSGGSSGTWEPGVAVRKAEVRLWTLVKQLEQLRNSGSHDHSNAASKWESERLPASTREQSGPQRRAVTNLPQHLREQIWPLPGFKTNLVPELSKNPIIEKEKSQRSMKSGGNNLPALSSCL